MVDGNTKNSKTCLEQVAEFRALFKIPQGPIKNIFSVAIEKEYIIIEFPNSKDVSGFFVEKKDRENCYRCIYINSNEPIGRKNFTLSHELFHSVFKKSDTLLCKYSDRRKNPIEKEAEMFASNLLIPRDHLYEHLKKKQFNVDYRIEQADLFELQKIYNVSFQSVLYALDDMQKNDSFKDAIPIGISAFRKYYVQRYWSDLSKETFDYDKQNLLNRVDPKYTLPEKYINLLKENYKRNLLSSEEFNELKEFFDFSS